VWYGSSDERTTPRRKFSGGHANQRVAVARALAGKRPILLPDRNDEAPWIFKAQKRRGCDGLTGNLHQPWTEACQPFHGHT